MTLRRVSTGSGSGCDALDAAGVLLRRDGDGDDDGDDGGVVDSSTASAHRRLESTRSKLAERRASILRRRNKSSSSSLLRRAAPPRRWRSCVNLGSGEKDDDTKRQRRQQQRRERVRRHSDPCGDGGENRGRGGACVTFSSPLVTDVETRPYTDPDDKDALFYSRSDIALFKARRKRHRSRDGDEDRDRDITFADEVVTDVWDPATEADAGSTTFFEDERAMREGLYYTQEELQGFLQEFLASLEAGTQDDDDDGGDDECRVGEEPVHAVKEQTANDDDDKVGRACAPSFIDEYDFFDDVPLDGDGGCDCAVPEGVEDSDTDSSDDSDSDSDSGSEDVGEDIESVHSGGGAAVWPSPPSAAVPDLQCRRGALAAEPPYAAGRTSNFPDSVACAAAATGDAGDDSAADEWDDVDCDAAPVMGGRLPRPPAVPVLGC